jgi:hypothetical protein
LAILLSHSLQHQRDLFSFLFSLAVNLLIPTRSFPLRPIFLSFATRPPFSYVFVKTAQSPWLPTAATMEQQREREREQQHHMLAPADVGHHETLPPLNLLPLPQPPTTVAQQSQRQQHGTDPGPPPPFPRLHQNPNQNPNPNAVASPPSYSHSALPLRFPDVPTTELPPPRPRSMAHNDGADQTLPSLTTLTGIPPLRNDPARQHQHQQQQHWPVLNPIKSYPVHSTKNQLPKIDSADVMELDTSRHSVGSAASVDHTHDARASSVSLDDPDVRLAAEALGDLRADFVSSPPGGSNPSALMAGSPTAPSHRQSNQPEPLLSLLTTSHPLLATTIEGATSAYGGAKNFSPRFKSSAEYVEGYRRQVAAIHPLSWPAARLRRRTVNQISPNPCCLF